MILKWRIVKYGAFPNALYDKLFFLIKVFFDPFVLSGFFSAFIASLFWMAAMTKFELSFAYPFMSASFILVFLLSVFLFHEAVTWNKIIGLLVIGIGIFITSRSL